MKTEINPTRINKVFEKAEKENRNYLLEHEVYDILREIGIKTPRCFFLKKGEKADARRLASLKSSDVVLKVVCPLIVHKTDVGGVMFVRNNGLEVNRTVKGMLADVPKKFLKWRKTFGHYSKERMPSREDIEKEIRGVIILEKVDFEKAGLGEELLLGLRNTRDFGPVVTIGLGGLDVEYVGERMKEGRAFSVSSVHHLRKKDVFRRLEPLAFYDKLVKEFRGREPLLPKEELAEACLRFAALGEAFSPYQKRCPYVIEEMEINPLVIREKKLVALDCLCRFSRRHQEIVRRPKENIHRLLHPRTIGIIGVSEKMNLGRIILNNILREGFGPENVFVVKPGTKVIEGCRCVPTIADLPAAVDLFVLTLPAGKSYEVMNELIIHEKAGAVVIISGGIGEKKGTERLEEKLKSLLEDARKKGGSVPVVNGGNCMGIYSRPGRYDSTFIPEYKLVRPAGKNPKVVYISQSGAFIACRMSKFPRLVPLYAVSLGNQIDLAASDYLRYFDDMNIEEARVYALYIEGFKPADGLALAEAAAGLIKKGKKVVVYKAGRTAEGKAATSSHTASVAGDYAVSRSVLESAGVFIAEDIFEFENLVKNLVYLENKPPRGNRVGLVSNAGFECVIMADNMKNGYELRTVKLSGKTKTQILEFLAPLGIDRLQDVRNPLDLTPVATDAAFAGCVEAVLGDEGVDCAVISPVPMTSALQTLAPGEGHREDICDVRSIGRRLIKIYEKSSKPIVVSVDAGDLYNPLVEMLEEAGVPTFRRADEAVRFMGKFVRKKT